MSEPYVYDKAKYHSADVENYGLPESYASHHTAYFLRWLIENDLMSDFFKKESSSDFDDFNLGKISAVELYESWDGCLIDEMVSDQGNEFGKFYFDLEKGQYIHDYAGALQSGLKSTYHIPFNEENYRKLTVECVSPVNSCSKILKCFGILLTFDSLRSLIKLSRY